MMERLLAEIGTKQAKTYVNLNDIIAEIRTNNEKVQVLRNKMWVSHEEMKAMMETCLEEREGIPKEVEAVVERQEVPNGATREMIAATED
jgi:hypothetical protein